MFILDCKLRLLKQKIKNDTGWTFQVIDKNNKVIGAIKEKCDFIFWKRWSYYIERDHYDN